MLYTRQLTWNGTHTVSAPHFSAGCEFSHLIPAKRAESMRSAPELQVGKAKSREVKELASSSSY